MFSVNINKVLRYVRERGISSENKGKNKAIYKKKRDRMKVYIARGRVQVGEVGPYLSRTPRLPVCLRLSRCVVRLAIYWRSYESKNVWQCFFSFYIFGSRISYRLSVSFSSYRHRILFFLFLSLFLRYSH